MAKTIYKFTKGQIVHLDTIYNILAFVLVEGYSTPYRNKHLSRWDAGTSDEHIILKNFIVEITVRDGKK